jgi:uncharacterized protein (TIGR00251 family)
MSPKPTRVNLQSRIKVKVLPRSSRNQIIGKEGDLFKVKLTSPPVAGKANKALIEFLAKKLGIPKAHMEIKSGKSSKLKSILIHGLTLEEITQSLNK